MAGKAESTVTAASSSSSSSSSGLGSSNLPDDLSGCHALIRELIEQLQDSHRRSEQLEHRLQQLLRQRYGPRAETVNPADLLPFARDMLEHSPSADPNEASLPEAEAATSEKPSRRRGRRKPGRDLPRVRMEYDLPADEKPCPACGEMRSCIGEETSEQYDYEPAKVFVVEHARKKYACRCCEGQVVAADRPLEAIDRCLAGPGLLAQIAVSKYGDHLPLYRLEGILRRHGVNIPRSTTCGWMAGCADALAPLVDLMSNEIRGSQVIHTDDTPLPVQEKGKGKTKTGRFWTYVGDDDHPYLVYDYTPTRARDGPAAWLGGFEGYLQADAYAGYDELYSKGRVFEVACWAHARRKFYDARRLDPGRCHQMLAWIKMLYAVERKAKEGNLDAEGIRALRQEKSRPLLEEKIKPWLDAQIEQVLPKSPVAQAIQYLRSRWPSFTRYCENGTLDIDNNEAERALRRVAVGRKNWLFAGSDRGGKTAAVLVSLVATCQRHDVDPYRWFRDVLSRIASFPMKRLAELLPDQWKADHPDAVTPPRS